MRRVIEYGYLESSSEMVTYGKMLLAKASESCGLRSMNAFHWHEKLVPPSTSGMKREEARRLAALYASARLDITYRAFLIGKFEKVSD